MTKHQNLYLLCTDFFKYEIVINISCVYTRMLKCKIYMFVENITHKSYFIFELYQLDVFISMLF